MTDGRGDDRASAREPSDDPSESIAGSSEPTADADADDPRSADGTPTAIDRLPKTVRRVRAEPGPHLVALAMAVPLGLAVAWLHWVGLLIGGALVGLCARSLPRAVGGGIAFGVLVLVVFALSLGTATPAVVGMAPAVYLAVGAAIGLPAFGALVRGVI